ncbi:O-antigen ligase family protein [Myxococcota bacterium]|nr:O-antigen ligase family protein [Myxococcota bacterium]
MQHALDRSATLAAIGGLLLAPLLAWPIVQAPKMAGLVLFLVLFEALLIRAPTWGVPLMAAGMLFDDVFIPTPIALLGPGDLTAFAALPAWFIHRGLRLREGQIGPYWYLPAFYLTWAFLSMMMGVQPRMAYGGYSREVAYVLAMFAIVDLSRDVRTIERSFQALAITGFFVAMHAMLTDKSGYRISGFSEPNVLGMRLGFAALPAMGLLLRAKTQISRVFYGTILTALIAALILTISRGTYISFGVAFLWWSQRYRRLAVVAAVVIVAAITVAPKLVKEAPSAADIQRRFEMRDTSVVNRFQVVKNALQMIVERPTLGVGFGQFTELHKVVEIHAEKARGSHNYYLGLAASTGVPALLAMLAFFGLTARALWRRRRAAEAAGDAHSAWALSLLQALMIFHVFTLVVRGATRIAEWYMFGLYVAGTLLLLQIPTSATKPPSTPP